MLVLSCKSSRIEFLFQLGCHGVSGFALAQSSLSPAVVSGFLLLIGGSLVHCAGLWPLTSRAQPERIDIAAHHCVLHYCDKQMRTALPRVLFHSGWLLVLRFDALLHSGAGATLNRSAPVTMLLLPDSLDANSDRLLRVYLRFQRR